MKILEILALIIKAAQYNTLPAVFQSLADWSKDDEWVTQTARDLAKILTDQGLLDDK